MNKNEEYIIFCKKESELPLFFQPWYLNAVVAKENWEVILEKKGTEIAAVMLIPKSKKFGFQFSRMPHLTKYLGIYFTKKFRSTKQKQRLTKNIVERIPNFIFFEHSFFSSFDNHLPFYWKNFEATIRYTFTIDLTQKLDVIFSKIESNYRNNKIAKAKKIIQITSERSLLDFYDVQNKTFLRQKLKMPFSFDFLKKYDKILEEHNARKIFFAADEKNQIHSVLYLIWDKKTAYLHMTGDDPNLRNSGANILLTWHAIQYAKEVLQKDLFDFEGSMMEPIAKVRQSFGAQQVPYFHIKKYNSPFIKILHQLKS